MLDCSKSREGVVYVGNDFKLSKFLPHRNMQGLKSVIDFDILSGLTHNVLMDTLTQYKIGLTPWRSHPFHKYCEPNKHYEYLHAGLQVLVTHSLYHPFQDEPYVHSFTNYEEIPEMIKSIPEIEPMKIAENAREKYVWENQEQTIRDVYKLV
ncbi:MAG: hypothetical protein ACTSQZ_09835 [Candidatus Thorarchaeota archaeon]